MDEALRFFKVYEIWIYVLLGTAALYYIRRFMQAWREMRGAVFGLERENAQARLNQAASALVILLIMGVGEFVVVSFVAPLAPGASPLPTPTLDLLATPTTTLEDLQAGPEGQEASEPSNPPTPLPTVELSEEGCLPGEIAITSPRPGAELSGEVEIRGTADVPNFGFYKLEYARREEPLWLTIQAGRQVVRNDVLVQRWDTSLIGTGEFILQLVVVDNTGQTLMPCHIPVRVIPP